MRRILPLMLIILTFASSCPIAKEDVFTSGGFLDLGIGINIGNTFDSLNTGNIAGEIGWGNPKVSRDYIKALKTHGFKTIRLPVSWVDYMGAAPNYTIDPVWMDRVAEVVNWILDEEMFCVLNLHHDGGGEADGDEKYWIKKISLPGKENEVTNRFIKVWEQIAVRFRGYSDYLILESFNEIGFDNLWNRYQGGQAEQKAEAYRLVNKLNQTFVDAVRSTGGRNVGRHLLVAGYWTDITNSCDPLFKMPQDTAENKLLLSVHYYTPWNFCGGNSITWGTPENFNELNNLFNRLKTNFIDNDVPIILGEYGVDIRSRVNNVNYDKDPESRILWMTAVTQVSIDMGICPVLWDTGMRPNNLGMADIQREAPFAISDDLQAMLDILILPEQED